VSAGYDYGNARVAARRGRLLGDEAVARLADSGSAAAAAAQLERVVEWRSPIEQARQVSGDAASALALAIEIHRSSEIARLRNWYDGQPARLVEALVMPLDHERVTAILRRRRAGEPAEAILPTIVRGALLSSAELAHVARAATAAAAMPLLVRFGLLLPADASQLLNLAEEAGSTRLEGALLAAWDRARDERAASRGIDARRVATLLAEERADRLAVRDALEFGGAASAALVERATVLARAEVRARRARRDLHGIGAVAGFIAAVDAEAVRLRVVLARLAGGWSRGMARSFLAGEAA
jgi:vacuolar-type H+-ATPase subunit C/Vma6